MGGPQGLASGAANAAALRASLMQLLEEQRREAEVLLERHQEALRQAVERALPSDTTPTEDVEPLPASESPRDSGLRSESANPTPRRNSKQSRFGKKGRGKSAFIQTLVASQDFDSDQRRPSFGESTYSLLNSSCVETVMGVLIIINTVIIYAQLEVEGRRAADVLDHGHGEVFEVFSQFFTVIFLIELILKLAVYRCGYFRSAFNIFDFLVVIITTIDVYVFSHVVQRNLNVSFLRTMRMLRLARLFRVVRTMNIFQKLRVLMKTIVLSFMSVQWSMLILFIFMLLSALLLCQLLQDFIVDPTADSNTRAWVNRYYGTSTKALYTIFEATFSGCWPNYARQMIEEVSAWYAAFWVLYVVLVVFTLIRIVYALLLKDTLQAAANDADQVVQEKRKETKAFVNKLSELFKEADESGDGYLSREEFNEILSIERVNTWMSAMGVDVQDTQNLFNILDDNNADGLISWEEFVHGIMRMRGHAHEQDLLCNTRDTHRILKHCEKLRDEVTSLRLPEQGAARGSGSGKVAT